MSNRMCASCKNVVSNTCYSGDICPNCDSNEWASPLDYNGEWEIIRKLQQDLMVRTFDLKKRLRESTERESKLYHKNEKLEADKKKLMEVAEYYAKKTHFWHIVNSRGEPQNLDAGYIAQKYLDELEKENE